MPPSYGRARLPEFLGRFQIFSSASQKRFLCPEGGMEYLTTGSGIALPGIKARRSAGHALALRLAIPGVLIVGGGQPGFLYSSSPKSSPAFPGLPHSHQDFLSHLFISSTPICLSSHTDPASLLLVSAEATLPLGGKGPEGVELTDSKKIEPFPSKPSNGEMKHSRN